MGENNSPFSSRNFVRLTSEKTVAIFQDFGIIKLSKERKVQNMYARNDLIDINMERARLIGDAITELKHNAARGVAYTARDLSKMTGGIIPTSLFEKSLARGYRALRKREFEGVREEENTYSLFNDWRAECHIQKEGARLITIKEYDEDGNLISEYQRRRGRPYYVAIF